MSELEARIRVKLRISASAVMPPRWEGIKRHYEARIAQGMKLAYAVDQAFCNLSGSNRHDIVRGSVRSTDEEMLHG